MKKQILLPFLAILAAGCVEKLPPQPITNDHPAAADAQSADMPAVSTTLKHNDPISGPAGDSSSDTSMGSTGDSHQMKTMNVDIPSATAPTGQYTCTMHPEVISDKPDNCPKCGMKLVKKTQDGMTGGAHGGH